MNLLTGKVAVITGAASGIGEATARRFASEGAALVLCDKNRAAGEAVAAATGGTFFYADVTSEADVEATMNAAVELHGKLDCVINNAGSVGPSTPIADLAAADWRAALNVLLDSVFFGIKHAARIMVPQGEGCIISTASVAGLSAFGPHSYVTAKHGVVGLTKSAASELAASGVRVNAIAPGAVPTSLLLSKFDHMNAVRDYAAAKSPLGKVIEPEDIANGFLYLAGDSGRSLTGQILVIDGGLVACPDARRAPAQG